jgi:predicted transcriptional regulator
MYDNTLELAENKLLLLYVFNEIKLSVSNNQLTQIILENNFINYFTLQQYISELVASNFLEYIETNKKHRLIITNEGIRALNLFINRISKTKKETIDDYLKKQIDNIKKEITITSDYTIEKENNFIVNLKAMENDSILIDIKLNVASNKQARDLCSKWKNNSSDLYSKIIQLLTEA